MSHEQIELCHGEQEIDCWIPNLTPLIPDSGISSYFAEVDRSQGDGEE